MSFRIMTHIQFLAFMVSMLTTHAEVFSATIETWKRAPGDHQYNSMGEKKLNLKNIQSKKLSMRHLMSKDLQYDTSESYKGVWLSELIRFSDYPSTNLAILHLEGGMRIPLRKSFIKKDRHKVPVFVAFTMKQPNSKKYTMKFRDSYRESFMHQTPLPIHFSINKLVVKPKNQLFGMPKNVKGLSPWREARSLIGIEYANQAAYERQFTAKGNSQVQKGQQVFLDRCQYCHGLNGVGSTFGWDVNGPIPLHNKRTPKTLIMKVKLPKSKSNPFSTFMPHQFDFTEKSAKDLWKWFAAASKQGAKRYNP